MLHMKMSFTLSFFSLELRSDEAEPFLSADWLGLRNSSTSLVTVGLAAPYDNPNKIVF